MNPQRPWLGSLAWSGLGAAFVCGLAGLAAKWPWLVIAAVIPAALSVGSIIFRLRQHAQAELERERFLIETLLDNIPDHIYFKDRESRFIRINRAMARVFKLKDPSEAVGKNDFDFFLPEHARQAFEDEQAIIRTGQPLVNREEKETWPDGTVTWVSTTKVAIRDKSSQIVGTFGVSRDVTARKRAEEALAQSARELARSNRELEQFAYVASHDLQEPLRMIASYLQLLERRCKEALDDEGREFLFFAVEGAKRLQQLIHDLLLYSRVGRQGDSFTWIECEECLSRALANLKFAIDQNQARITHGPLPRLLADATQLTQLFQNLIGNAIKFRGEKLPEIHITAELRKVQPAMTAPASGVRPSRAQQPVEVKRRRDFQHADEEQRAAPETAALRSPACEEWVFAVSDNGIGIEPKYFERIFVLFQRLHTPEECPGTGIGLALCKRIIERHGGRIWVESQTGKGSTFWFNIPQTETPA